MSYMQNQSYHRLKAMVAHAMAVHTIIVSPDYCMNRHSMSHHSLQSVITVNIQLVYQLKATGR